MAIHPAAATVVDQTTLYTKGADSSYLASGFGRSNWISQGFTAGLSGSLDRLDLQIAAVSTDSLRLTIGAGEIIDGDYSILATVDVPLADLPTSFDTLFSIDLSGFGVEVSAGQLYSITLSSAVAGTGNQFGWLIGEIMPDGTEVTLPAYDGGRALGSNDAGATWGIRGSDRTFRTWVTADVPEPSSWAMLIVGFGFVGSAIRRQRVFAA